MTKYKWVCILILLGMAGAIGGYFITNAAIGAKEKEKPTIAEQVDEASKEVKPDAEGVASSLTKKGSKGAVAVKSTLLPEKSNSTKLVFEVVMNTHSVDLLQYNLAELAEISFGTGTANQSFVWEPSSSDGHHLSGSLIWNGEIDKNYQDITLTLKNIDNVPSRVFNWKKGELKAGNFNL